MRALEFITGHVIYNPAYTYKFQLKTTFIRILNSKFRISNSKSMPCIRWANFLNFRIITDLVKEVAHYKQIYHQKCLKPFDVADLPSWVGLTNNHEYKFTSFLNCSLFKYVWQLSATIMSWVGRWVELVVY